MPFFITLNIAGSLRSLGLMAMIYFVPAIAMAQNAPSRLPASIDSGRTDQQLQGSVRDGTPSLEKEDIKPLATAPALSNIAHGFTFRSASFEGNTAISGTILQSLMVPYIGKKIDKDFAERLSAYLTGYYRQEGYFLSVVYLDDINPATGILSFFVVEGYVGRITLKKDNVDSTSDWQGLIAKYMDKIAAMKPLHGPTLERYLLLINDLYGVSAGTTLVPLTDMENPPVGAVGMIVNLRQEKRFSGSVDYNNFASVFSGPAQGLYTINTGTPLHPHDNLRLSVLHAFPLREMRYGQIEYTLPVGADGLTVNLKTNKSLLRPTDNLTPFDLESNAESVGASFSYPLIRSRAENLYLSGSFEASNSQTDVLGVKFFDDRIRALDASLNYSFIDGANAQNVMGASITQGLNILGARETGSRDLSRLEGHSDFTKFNAHFVRDQYLPYGFEITGKVLGQYALSQLLSSEEFGYGGPEIGQAYDNSEIIGDHGLSASIEARYSHILAIESIQLNLQPFAFYDIGKVWNIENGQQPESGASAGFGLRFNAGGGHLSGKIGAAYPLTRDTANPIRGDGDDPRFFFQLIGRF